MDAIREAIKELETAGYVRARQRDERGGLGAAEYVIYEAPQPISEKPEQPEKTESQRNQQVSKQPTTDAPMLGRPMLASPMLETPILDNPTQGNPKAIYPSDRHEETVSEGSKMQAASDLSNTICAKVNTRKLTHLRFHNSAFSRIFVWSRRRLFHSQALQPQSLLCVQSGLGALPPTSGLHL